MAPYQSYDSVVAVREETIKKEIDAATTLSWNAPLDWTPILSLDRRDRRIRMYHNLPLNEDIHKVLHSMFLRSKFQLEGKIIYPKVSKKTIGKEAQEIAEWKLLHPVWGSERRERVQTIKDVEQVYHRTGEILEGPVEMRVAWKYNDLKPRVYYAQGPSAYARSKFIQPVFNVILDCFDFVHRHNRYSLPEDRELSISDLLVIYDYSSFTSNLEAIKDFTRQLAEFFVGTQVILVDTWTGPRVADLRDLLIEYTEHCNESSVFDAQRVLERDHPVLLQHTCGMLGIPGNISSCTLLHGLHLCIIVESILRCRCIGDDALAKLWRGILENRLGRFQTQVNNLGEVAEDKFATWSFEDDPDSSAWHYTKRPITRMDAGIAQGISLIWPSIANILNLSDEFHTTTSEPITTRRKTFIAQWSRLLDHTRSLCPDISVEDKQLLVCFQNKAYRELGLRKGGYFKSSDGRIRLILPVLMTEEDFDLDWRRFTLDWMATQEAVELPQIGSHREILGYLGETCQTTSTKMYSLLEALGYLEKNIVHEIVDFRTLDRSMATIYLDLSYDFMYEYVVLEDFPVWVKDLQYIEPMSPHERISYLQQ